MNGETMKKTLLILSVTTLTAVLTACNTTTKNPQTIETNQSNDTVQTGLIQPIIKNIFYNLPLEKPRLDVREVILNDKRFVLTDTTFNNYKPSTFFKGVTTDKGVIKSNPDSIEVMLIYGNAALKVEKVGQEDPNRHPMILEFQYFFSNIESAEMEYERILNLVQPIYTDTSSIIIDNWKTGYSKGTQKGTQKCIGKIFDSFEPYYRLAVSNISYIPEDDSKPVFVLNIAFSKADK